MPKPWVDAIECVSVANGWSPECLNLALFSNASFLAHPKTRLRDKEGAEHSVNTDVAVAVSLPVSAKKSGMEDMCKKLVTGHKHADKRLVKASMGDATVKGVRECLRAFSYAMVHSSEPVNTFETPYAESEKGIQFFPRNKVNTWVQSEEDETATGNGPVQLRNYHFKMLLVGQIEVNEFIVRPQGQGFEKRISVAYRTATPPHDDLQLCSDSMVFLVDAHGYWHKHEATTERQPHLGGKGLGIYRHGTNAVKRWVDENQHALTKHMKSKLDFYKSDLLRAIDVVRKVARSIVFMSDAEDKSEFLDICFEDPCVPLCVVAGFRHWRRQAHYHLNYYRFIKRNPLPLLKGLGCQQQQQQPQQRPNFERCGFGEGLVGEPELVEQPLAGIALVKHTLLKDARTRGEVQFTQADVKDWYGRRKAWPEELRKPEMFHRALAELVADGLLVDLGPPPMKNDGKRGGRKPLNRFAKRRFSEIAGDEATDGARKALRVHRENFVE